MKSEIEILNLEENLNKLEIDLENQYIESGKKILELSINEQQKIDSLINEIIEIKKRLIKVKKEKQCPSCMTYNTSDSNYCKFCGKSIKS
ncbi:zinc ribbon domain-containing protein [Anaerosphaera multitolerans]|uniref:Zinc ribbon domain-containing protein n=1 Tax=Anaerosphaera multitolerans TaxID=2487351 RepID=A0A437S5E2_9FIRM|nr:zinc ribbon domain-containing protein [Anaerosphaera multitolerans]RVU54231.1 zinc ribbon domain-containing protein [Anaerosphaera multitolerans]